MNILKNNLKVNLDRIKQLEAESNLPPLDPAKINLHIHTHYSYNAYGWSPSDIAWQARKNGLYAAGIIDFDVLDGLDEFLLASELLGLRSTVGLETRTFNTLYAEREIDSPGEPGVSYISGTGFTRLPEGDDALFLESLKKTAHARNENLINRINAQLHDIAIDYHQDVVPLTPSGNATERHIVKAYIDKSKKVFSNNFKLQKFWSQILGKEIDNLLSTAAGNDFENSVRSRLAKKGGLGYEQPTSKTFPKTEEVFSWIVKCGAIPLESWLDGTSEGESNPKKYLEDAYAAGARALNIIPDRNWNIRDIQEQKIKYRNLEGILDTARKMQMPVMIGTEMNKMGQPLFDDLTNVYLKPFAQDFISGANIIVGHHILARFADFAYVSGKAEQIFGKNIAKKNLFFNLVGALPPVTSDLSMEMKEAGSEKSFEIISDSVKMGNWII